MLDRDRALNYIAIFIGLGDDWPSCAPVDGVRTERGIRIGTAEVWPDPEQSGTWLLDDGTNVKRYTKKEPARA
ncbi:hypothetical protein [Saccharothrix stipae]